MRESLPTRSTEKAVASRAAHSSHDETVIFRRYSKRLRMTSREIAILRTVWKLYQNEVDRLCLYFCRTMTAQDFLSCLDTSHPYLDRLRFTSSELSTPVSVSLAYHKTTVDAIEDLLPDHDVLLSFRVTHIREQAVALVRVPKVGESFSDIQALTAVGEQLERINTKTMTAAEYEVSLLARGSKHGRFSPTHEDE